MKFDRVSFQAVRVVAFGTLTLSSAVVSAQISHSLVALQSAFPGTAQVGHINITGSIRAGGLQLPVGASDGAVLRSDSTGVASWGPDGLALPFTGISTFEGDAFRIESTGPAIKGVSTQLGLIGLNSATGTLVEIAGQNKGLAAFNGNTGVSAHLAQEFDAVFGHNAVSMTFGYLGTRWEGVLGVTPNENQAAVFGDANRASGFAMGVLGNTNSPDGEAVVGNNPAVGTIGLLGTRYDGVVGRNYSAFGSGVYGYAHGNGSQNYGVFGRSDSMQGYGLHGQNSGTGNYGDIGGPSIGVYGNSNTEGAAGVYGYMNALYGSGVVGNGLRGNTGSLGNYYDGAVGVTVVPSGAGVWGQTNFNDNGTYGVLGLDVYGYGFGVYSIGNFGASGLKSFQIDHPLDPEHAYLRHYCSEGPEPTNQYGGTVRTDASGQAWVQLPDYFEAINAKPRYNLTVIDEGEDFVQVKVARKIENGRFLIRTSRPHVEVCWQVLARRNDAHVRRYGAPVEVEKQGAEIGKYQRPELYGKPASAGIYDDRLRDEAASLANRPAPRSDPRSVKPRRYPKSRL